MVQVDSCYFKDMLLTDELLFNYQRCQRLSFLNVYGDPSHQDPASDFLRKLKHDSEDYRNSVLAGRTYEKPVYRYGDWETGARATVELMQRGVELIYQGILLKQGSQGITLLTRPHLLVKQPGYSTFGDWLYAPIDIRFSKRPKSEHQIVIAFHTQVLASVQGASPGEAWLICREKGEYWVNLTKYVPLMQQVLAECIDMLVQRQEPEVFITRHPCDLCEWYGSCYAIAQSNRHLSLLPGVTPTRYRKLRELQITTLEALANADISELSNHLVEVCNNQYEPDEVAHLLVLQAKATLHNRAIAKPGQLSGLATQLPVSPVELYFDIEAQPELDLDFLLGVLVVDRRSTSNGGFPKQTFYPFLAKSQEEEGAIWEQFLNLIWAYPIAPIFHFCDYEYQTVKKLAKRYHTSSHRWRPVLKRFVDIHKLTTRTVVMPVESYALKSLARWLGFNWRDALASGGQCVFWYDGWLKTGDRSYLDSILGYNEDDCRATYVLKDWLVNFMQKNSQP